MSDWPAEHPTEVPTPRLVHAWLVLDTLPTERVPVWAAHWIADGCDGESLRQLAGLHGDDPHVVRDLLDDALRECGIERPDISTSASVKVAAAMEAFTAVAKLQVAGRASERWVVSKVYEIVEPEFDQAITDLPLGRLYSLEDEWWGRADDKLCEAVRRACREQLDAAFGPDRAPTSHE